MVEASEFRSGKAGLRRRHDIRDWSSFYANLQAEMDQLAADVQLADPCPDTNRSRWPLHPLWAMAQDASATRLFEHDVEVPEHAVRAIDLHGKRHDMLKMISSLTVTLAYLERQSPTTFPLFCATLTKRLQRLIAHHPRGLEERFAEAVMKYGEVFEGY